jgi:hypothetical protein
MPLAMPPPDFEPRLAAHLEAFETLTAVPAPPCRKIRDMPMTEDADPVGSERHFRANHLMTVYRHPHFGSAG